MTMSGWVEQRVLGDDMAWVAADDIPDGTSFCAEWDDFCTLVIPANADTVERYRLVVSERIARAHRVCERDGRHPASCVAWVGATALAYLVVSTLGSAAVVVALTVKGMRRHPTNPSHETASV